MMNFVAALLFCLPFMAHGYFYGKCELAGDLLDENVPEGELHKWVCMAEHESRFDTSAIAVNRRGDSDYGIFQINSKWNCDPEDGRFTYNGCGHPCSDFINIDLSDDVACIKQLKRERRGSFSFSYGYMRHCQDVTSDYLSECESD